MPIHIFARACSGGALRMARRRAESWLESWSRSRKPRCCVSGAESSSSAHRSSDSPGGTCDRRPKETESLRENTGGRTPTSVTYRCISIDRSIDLSMSISTSRSRSCLRIWVPVVVVEVVVEEEERRPAS